MDTRAPTRRGPLSLRGRPAAPDVAHNATRGAQRARPDLTDGPIARTLILFTLPVLGSNALQAFNSSVNVMWVSHVLGETALTATANATIIFQFLLGVVFGIAMAANILVAQAVGARDMDQVKRVVGTSTLFFLTLSVAVAVGGYALSPAVLSAMKTPLDARPDAIAYLRVVFLAMPFMYFFAYLMMAQRGLGDSRTPFVFMLIAVCMDVVFNPILIMGLFGMPRLGIAGSATSTLIAQGASLSIMVGYMYVKRSPLILRPEDLRHLRPDPLILRSLLVKGLPMGAQMLVISGSAIVMISLVNHYGSQTSAAYGAASQLWTYVQMPALALGAAVSSMSAQNVGAGRWDRINRITWTGVAFGLAVTGSLVAIIYALGDLPLRAFLPSKGGALDIARQINASVLWGFILFSAMFVFFGVVRSSGAVLPPLVILFISLWLIRVPFAELLMPRFGTQAIWWSFPLGTICCTSLAALYFLFGGWRKARMLADRPRGQAPDTGVAPPTMGSSIPLHDAIEPA